MTSETRHDQSTVSSDTFAASGCSAGRTRGAGLVPVMTIETAASIWTNSLRVRATGLTPFEFDDFRVMTRAEDQDQSAGFTYNDANQLTAMAVMGLTLDFAYDAWGRIASRSIEIGEDTYTATYAYRYGDKLRYITSDFPGETAYIGYNYDGLGKRRFRYANDQYTWWRWDLGWSAATQYADTNTNWTVEGFNRFFVPFGHAALAEADVTTTPAQAAYNYLAQDHLGTGRFVYNQAKTETASVEHLPYGDRYAATGDAPYHEFTGKPWDEDAGLFYFPYRYYAPTIARWISPDPLGIVDGPNVYGYVSDSPVSQIDILGLDSQDPCENPCASPRCRCPNEGYYSCLKRHTDNCENCICSYCDRLPGRLAQNACWANCVLFIGSMCLLSAFTGCILTCTGRDLAHCGG
jgi:RHS repeat-associated protein